MPSPKKRWKAENMNPKTHVSLTPQELNTYQNVHGGNGKGVKAKKVMDLDGSGAYAQGPGSLFGLVFAEKLSPFYW